jgi:hypothetical protein
VCCGTALPYLKDSDSHKKNSGRKLELENSLTTFHKMLDVGNGICSILRIYQVFSRDRLCVRCSLVDLSPFSLVLSLYPYFSVNTVRNDDVVLVFDVV